MELWAGGGFLWFFSSLLVVVRSEQELNLELHFPFELVTFGANSLLPSLPIPGFSLSKQISSQLPSLPLGSEMDNHGFDLITWSGPFSPRWNGIGVNRS